MIAHPFRYRCPDSVAEAVQLLAEPGAVAMAGGTWLLPQMGRAERHPSVVVDLRRLDLSAIAEEGDALVLGACTTYEQLKVHPAVRDRAPVLRTMARGITGGQGITGQATIGGAACYANPSSDVPGCLVALGARMRLASLAGEREVAVRDFFTGPFRTARRPDEMLVAIVLDAPGGRAFAGCHKLKLSGGSWPIATAACCVARRDGRLHARLAIGAAGPVPAVAEAVLPTEHAGALLPLIAAALAGLTEGWGDELAAAEYRLAVAPEVARRAVVAAQETLHA